MKLNKLLNTELLIQHAHNHLVGCQRHPTLPLRIYNYTHEAAHNPIWGDGTIDYCRGLIVDDRDEIVSFPFKKFHNLNTIGIPETMYENLPKAMSYHATEKVDGSLGIYYDDWDGGAIATRGSFTSPQAQFATKWFKENIIHPGHFWDRDETPLFEIIYPENRIVVDYGGWSGLVVLGIIDNNTGKERPWLDVKARFYGKMRIAKDYSGLDISDLMKMQIPNEEGFVVTFSNGLKIKIKMDEYKRLHKIVTGMNPRAVWESLRDGKQLPNQGLPSNFNQWLRSWEYNLTTLHQATYWEAKHVYMDRPVNDGKNDRYYRAACARYFQANAKPGIQGVLFAMLDGKDVAPYIWKLLEPRGDDKSFKTEIE
jgi:RNA ligase